MRIKLTQEFADKATCPVGKEREVYWHTEMRRFGFMVTPREHRSYVLQYRNRSGESKRLKIDGAVPLKQALIEAQKFIGEIASGGDPLARIQKERNAGRTTVKAICEEYFRASAGKLRSLDQRHTTLERLVYGQIGSIQVDDLKWSRIRTMLNAIKEERGIRIAKSALDFKADRLGTADQRRIASILTTMGWTQVKRDIHGRWWVGS
jgi:Arm DNA-binding domain